MRNERFEATPPIIEPRIRALSALLDHPSSNKTGRVNRRVFKEALSVFKTDGPFLVRSIIDKDTTPERIEGTTSILLTLSILSPDAVQLKPIWPILKERLDVKRALQAGKPESAVRAFLIASGLLASAKQPPEERKDGKRKNISLTEAMEDTIDKRLDSELPMQGIQSQNVQLLIIKDVREAIARFKNLFEMIVTVSAKDKAEIMNNLTLIDALLRAEGSPIYKYYVNKTGEKGKHWVNRMTRDGSLKTILSNEQTAADLLFMGKLDGMAPLIRSLVCFCIIGGDLPKGEAITYFLKHPEVQEIFWRDFSENGWRGTDIKNLFLQDKETLLKILDTTLKAKYLKSISQETMRESLLKFIGTIAMIKADYPNHPNPHILSAFVREASEVKDPMISTLLDILDDKIPGFIYLDKKNHIRFKAPQEHQSRDSFLREIEPILRDNGLLYGSKTDILEQEKEPTPAIQNEHKEKPAIPTKEHPLDSIRGETESTPLWGEVIVPKPEDAQTIWDGVKQRFSQFHREFTYDKALRALAEENARARHENIHEPCVIIPELLPISIPVRMLTDLGVISIQQIENQVTIVLNPHIGNGGKDPRFVLSDQLDSGNQSPAQLLLRTALLMGRRSFSEQSFTGEERSEIRAQVKAWNSKTKTEHLPQIAFEEDPTIRINGPRVLAFIGKKPVILTIHQ